MVRPERIFELGVHHISKPFSIDSPALKLPKGLALTNHYRYSSTGFEHLKYKGIALFFSEYSNVTSRYLGQLDRNVREIFAILGLGVV